MSGKAYLIITITITQSSVPFKIVPRELVMNSKV